MLGTGHLPNVALGFSGASFLRAFSDTGIVRERLREILVDKAWLLPCDLPDFERQDLLEVVAAFIDLPVRVAIQPEDLREGSLCVVTSPLAREPDVPKGSVVLGVRALAAGRKRASAAPYARRVRTGLLDALMRRTDPRMDWICAWAEAGTDSPSTALRFVSAAWLSHLANPHEDDMVLLAEGLSHTIAWLFSGVDTRVAEWVLAHALPTKHPRRLVSNGAAILGQTAALQRALAAGLVEHLPEDADSTLDLRRPFAVLSQTTDLSPNIELSTIFKRLKPRLAPAVWAVIERFVHAKPKPLRLDFPLRRPDFVGREDVLNRLTMLLEPSHEIRTAALYGMRGLGKSAVASELCHRLSDRLEPVWVNFLEGPEPAWRRVATALALDDRREQDQRVVDGVPAWVKRVHEKIAERDAIVVIDYAPTVPEAELPKWLPRGVGSCVVLVLSTRAERVLQQENDAVPVVLRPLSLPEARGLLVSKVPVLEEAIERGEADPLLQRLDGHPGAIGMAAALLYKQPLSEVTSLIHPALGAMGPRNLGAQNTEPGAEAIRGIVRHVLNALDPEERAIVEVLSVSVPTGSAKELVERMIRNEAQASRAPSFYVSGALARLADRAAVELGEATVRLYGILQLAIETSMDASRRRELELAHAAAAEASMEDARERGDEALRDALYPDVMLAIERMTDRCRSGENEPARICHGLAVELIEYPRGVRPEALQRAISGNEAVLGILTREAAPDEWAHVHGSLGKALVELPIGDRVENLRRALTSFDAALDVYKKETSPHRWALFQSRRGIVYCELPGNLIYNVQQAILSHESALSVCDKEEQPSEWAMFQLNLGNAFSKMYRISGLEHNQQLAIAAYESALTVWSKENAPLDWATCQYNLALALFPPFGENPGKIDRAIEALNASLSVHTRDRHPEQWALDQEAIGSAWFASARIGHTENLGRAIDAFGSALEVFTVATFPSDFARVQRKLAAAFEGLRNADRKDNLRSAEKAIRAALLVWTKYAFPKEHAEAQALLATIREELSGLPSSAPPPPDREAAPPLSAPLLAGNKPPTEIR